MPSHNYGTAWRVLSAGMRYGIIAPRSFFAPSASRRTPGVEQNALTESMPRPRVTESERRLARLMHRDKAPLERIGIDAGARIGFRAQLAARRAMRRGDDPVAATRRELDKSLAILTHAMLAAHLTGRKRAALSAGPGLSLRLPKTGYEGVLGILTKRLGLAPHQLADLQAKHQADALRVLKATEDHVERELQKTLLKASAEGMHVREASKSLGEAFERLGLTPNNSFTLEALFRTQTAMAYSAGRFTAEQDPAIQEILWGYRYVTVGDDRVRDSHVGFDGVTLPKDAPFWQVNFPPNGWTCRCAVISVFEKRAEVEPPNLIDVDGKMVKPETDEGFRFNPGQALGSAV